MCAHAFFPQIPHGLIPVIVQELGNLIQLMVCQHLDILPQLLQSELRLRFTVRMVKDIHQLPDNIAEAVHKSRILGLCLYTAVNWKSRGEMAIAFR